MGTQLLPPQKGGGGAERPPQFSAHVQCGQMAGWIKMPLGMEEGLGPGDFVLDGDPASPPPKGGRAPPQFSAHVHCGQTAGWMDQDGTWHRGGPWFRLHCARLRSSCPPQKRGRSRLLIFGPFLLWPNGCIHQDATRYAGRPQHRRVCVRWGPRPPPPKGAEPPPQF